MEAFAKIAAQLEEARESRKALIEKGLDGRTQQWLADKIGVSKTRLSHCINGLVEFKQEELDDINKVLGTKFTLSADK